MFVNRVSLLLPTVSPGKCNELPDDDVTASAFGGESAV